MIYLIDDKKERQASFGWTDTKFEKYKQLLTPIYSYDSIKDVDDRKKIFNQDNMIFYHESFFDNPINSAGKNSQNIKQDLIKFSDENNLMVVFFGGSINSRNIDKLRATIPVSVLYKNLENFVVTPSFENKNDSINKIVYGENHHKEKILLIKREIWNLLYDKDNDAIFELSPLLKKTLDEFNSLTHSKIVIDNVSNSFLKFQINKCCETYE